MKKNRVRIGGVKQLLKFIRQSIEEFKRVQFPNKQETVRLTAYVIGISILAGLLVTLFDYLFKELLTFIITK